MVKAKPGEEASLMGAGSLCLTKGMKKFNKLFEEFAIQIIFNLPIQLFMN